MRKAPRETLIHEEQRANEKNCAINRATELSWATQSDTLHDFQQLQVSCCFRAADLLQIDQLTAALCDAND